MPENVLDLSAEFKCQVNGKGIPRKNQGLIGALQYFGLSSIAPKRKDAMRDRIYARLAVLARGTRADPQLLRRGRRSPGQAAVQVASEASILPIALHRGEAVAALARSEHVGVPIDAEIFSQLADKTAWREIRDSMVPLVDVHGIYVRDKRGDWHWNNERFDNGPCPRASMAAQGRHRQARSAAQDLREHGQGLSAGRAAAPAALHPRQAAHDPAERRTRQPQQNRVVAVLVENFAHAAEGETLDLLAVGVAALPDQAGAREGARLYRLFQHGVPGRRGAVGRTLRPRQPDAGALPQRRPLSEFRQADRLHPADATAKTPGIEAVRNRLKVLCLAAQYGMQTATLATRLGVSEIEAHEMLLHHRGLFSQYWHWSEDWLHHSLDSGTMRTVFGWECATGIVEFNERSIRNFPVQANCADLFRLAYVWGTRHGLTLIAPVHDAVLLESTDDRIEADVALMREIMRRASRVILNPTADGTIELRTDAKIIRYPDRFTDPRGEELWNTVLQLLAERRDRVAAADSPPSARNHPRALRRPMHDDTTPQQPAERDPAEWDAEIEAEFQRVVAADRAAGRKKRGQRFAGPRWPSWPMSVD